MSHPNNPYNPLTEALDRLRAEQAKQDAERAAERAAHITRTNLFPRRSNYQELEAVAARQTAAKAAEAAAAQPLQAPVRADHVKLHVAIQGQQQQREAAQQKNGEATALAQEQAATLDRIAREAQRIRDTERTSRQGTELAQLIGREERARAVEGERLRRFEPDNHEKQARHDDFAQKVREAVLNPDQYMRKEAEQERAGKASGAREQPAPTSPQRPSDVRDHVMAETRRAVQHQESDLVARHEQRVMEHNRGVQIAQAATRQATPADDRRAALRQRYSAGQEVTDRMQARADRQPERTDRQQVMTEQEVRRQALRERYASQPTQVQEQGRDR